MLPQSKDASHRHAPKALPPSGTSLELATLCVVRWQDTALLIFFFTELVIGIAKKLARRVCNKGVSPLRNVTVPIAVHTPLSWRVLLARTANVTLRPGSSRRSSSYGTAQQDRQHVPPDAASE
jgi:hypothetical protein